MKWTFNVNVNEQAFGIDDFRYIGGSEDGRNTIRLSFSPDQLRLLADGGLAEVAQWFLENGEDYVNLQASVDLIRKDIGQATIREAVAVMEHPFASPEERKCAREWLLRMGEARPARAPVAPAPRQPSPGTVYVLAAQDGSSRYKIGKTRSLNQRKSQLSTQLPFPVELRFSFACDDPDAVESALHRLFADRRVNGEWFTLTDDDLAWIEENASSEVVR